MPTHATGVTVNTNQISLVDIIKNTRNAYNGNLEAYFKIIFEHATNLKNPYHNFRHLIHVLFLCHDACLWDIETGTLQLADGRVRRNLLIAAMFHDFDHSGVTGDRMDAREVARAVEGFQRHVLIEDKPWIETIVSYIRATQFPHRDDMGHPTPAQVILQDADLAQCLDPVWIQQILFGLGEEMGKSPMEMLEMQGPFLANLRFMSPWARAKFPPHLIAKRKREIRDLMGILK